MDGRRGVQVKGTEGECVSWMERVSRVLGDEEYVWLRSGLRDVWADVLDGFRRGLDRGGVGELEGRWVGVVGAALGAEGVGDLVGWLRWYGFESVAAALVEASTGGVSVSGPPPVGWSQRVVSGLSREDLEALVRQVGHVRWRSMLRAAWAVSEGDVGAAAGSTRVGRVEAGDQKPVPVVPWTHVVARVLDDEQWEGIRHALPLYAAGDLVAARKKVPVSQRGRFLWVDDTMADHGEYVVRGDKRSMQQLGLALIPEPPPTRVDPDVYGAAAALLGELGATDEDGELLWEPPDRYRRLFDDLAAAMKNARPEDPPSVTAPKEKPVAAPPARKDGDYVQVHANFNEQNEDGHIVLGRHALAGTGAWLGDIVRLSDGEMEILGWAMATNDVQVAVPYWGKIRRLKESAPPLDSSIRYGEIAVDFTDRNTSGNVRIDGEGRKLKAWKWMVLTDGAGVRYPGLVTWDTASGWTAQVAWAWPLDKVAFDAAGYPLTAGEREAAKALGFAETYGMRPERIRQALNFSAQSFAGLDFKEVERRVAAWASGFAPTSGGPKPVSADGERREWLAARTDYELVELICQVDHEQASRVLDEFGGLAHLVPCSADTFFHRAGLARDEAARLNYALELARRLIAKVNEVYENRMGLANQRIKALEDGPAYWNRRFGEEAAHRRTAEEKLKRLADAAKPLAGQARLVAYRAKDAGLEPTSPLAVACDYMGPYIKMVQDALKEEEK